MERPAVVVRDLHHVEETVLQRRRSRADLHPPCAPLTGDVRPAGLGRGRIVHPVHEELLPGTAHLRDGESFGRKAVAAEHARIPVGCPADREAASGDGRLLNAVEQPGLAERRVSGNDTVKYDQRRRDPLVLQVHEHEGTDHGRDLRRIRPGDVPFQPGELGTVLRGPETLGEGLADRVFFTQEILEGTAGVPPLAHKPLTAVVGRGRGLVGSAVIVAFEDFGGIVDQQ